MPQWLWTFLGTPAHDEGSRFQLDGRDFVVQSGIPRMHALLSLIHI